MTDKLDQLRQAIDTGEVVTIIYHGGSQPGTSRQIQPRKLDSKHLRAIDVATHRNKQFLLDKLEIASGTTGAAQYDPSAPPPKTPSLSEFIEQHTEELASLGWHIEQTESSATLHHHFKNGKPQKTPRVGVRHEPYTTSLIIDDDEDRLREEQVPAKRPWKVFGINDATRSFKRPHDAFNAFLRLAREITPPKT